MQTSNNIQLKEANVQVVLDLLQKHLQTSMDSRAILESKFRETIQISSVIYSISTLFSSFIALQTLQNSLYVSLVFTLIILSFVAFFKVLHKNLSSFKAIKISTWPIEPKIQIVTEYIQAPQEEFYNALIGSYIDSIKLNEQLNIKLGEVLSSIYFLMYIIMACNLIYILFILILSII